MLDRTRAPRGGRIPPLQSWSSALIAALIGFGGTVALVVQAMRTLGASIEQTGSAVTALCIGIAMTGGLLSLRLRMPIVLAWSTPGAALLAATASGHSWPTVIGAFLASGAAMVAIGVVPALGAWASRIPPSVASAMLAGVLLPFCLGLFKVGATDPLLIGTIVVVFLAARQRLPLYALLIALGVGAALSVARGQVGALAPGATLGVLQFTRPAIDAGAIIGLGLPLFLVTLAAQNLPGLVVLRTSSYQPAPGPLLWGTGLASIVVAPFGGHAVNLSAITAAICTNADAHPDPLRRWVVGILYAGCYLVLALFAPLLVRFFVALPHDVIAALTGVALIPSLLGALDTALAATDDRDAAIVTFLAAGSGLTLFGLGAAFWGLVAGFVALAIKVGLRWRDTAAGFDDRQAGVHKP